MKDAFGSEFEKTLERMEWPRKDVNFKAEIEKEWTIGVEKLLDLQEPYVRVYLLVPSQHNVNYKVPTQRVFSIT